VEILYAAASFVAASELPNEKHATRVLSIVADIGVAMRRRRLTSSISPAVCAHGCIVPHVFDGALLAWGFAPTVLDVPGNLLDLLALNMVTNPVYHAFKCMMSGARPLRAQLLRLVVPLQPLTMLPCVQLLRAVYLLGIILHTHCPAYIRHAWSRSELQLLLHDRPRNPWVALDLFGS
jgi:hypothetical protein